jgi:hypothetical protein
MHYLLGMKVNQGFGHFDELSDSLLEHSCEAKLMTDQTQTIDIALEIGRLHEIFKGPMVHPRRDETVMFRGCRYPDPDEREDIRMIKLSPYKCLP